MRIKDYFIGLHRRFELNQFLWFFSPVIFLAIAGLSTGYAEVNKDGSFTTKVHILLPPASANLTPNIDLAYNSNTGNGIAGVGWNFSGFKAITRMNYGAGINYNSNDTFVGPAGRLVKVDAANQIYHSEKESWGRYIPYNSDGSKWTGSGGCANGPCYWKLTERDGKVLEFGVTSDSRIEAIGKSGAVRVWALNKVTDTNGNFYTVSYLEDTLYGGYYPTLVTYNQGNGHTGIYTVEFTYEGRYDNLPDFSQSANNDLNRRLKWITVKNAGVLVRKYRFDYEFGYYNSNVATGRSRLVAVQEYGSDGTSTLPAQTFVYQDGSNATSTPVVYASSGSSGNNFTVDTGGYDFTDSRDTVLTLDYNGDGRKDIIIYRPGGGLFYLYKSNGDGTFTLVNSGKGFNGYDFADSRDKVAVCDYNGDGRDDIITYRPGTGIFWIHRSNSDGTWTVTRSSNGFNGYNFADARDKVAVFDYNGDGYSDVITYRPGAGDFWIHRSNGDGTWTVVKSGKGINGYDMASIYDQVIIFDLNGDKRSDIITARPGGGGHFYVHRSNGDGTFTQVIAGLGFNGFDLASANDQIVIFDYNGDGNQDIITARAGNGAFFINRSNGDGTFTKVKDGSGFDGYDFTSPADKIAIFDYNGDGRQDVITYRPGYGNFWIHRSNGDGTWTAVKYGSGINNYDMMSASDQVIPFDFNGDGLSDLITCRPGHGAFYIHKADGVFPDLLVATTNINGNGGTETINYAAAPTVTGAVCPDLVTCGGGSGSICGNTDNSARQLVTYYAVTDADRNTLSTNYEYYNGRRYPGTGLASKDSGFQWIKEIDGSSGVYKVTYCLQDNLYYGYVNKTELFTNDGVLVTRDSYAYDISNPYSGVSLVKTTAQNEEYYESGVLQNSNGKSFSYDSFGNITLVSDFNDNSTAADDVFTVTTYINDTVNWILGAVSSVKVCADSNCATTIKTQTNYYDNLAYGSIGTQGNLTRRLEWSADTNTDRTYTYDNSGNMLTEWDNLLGIFVDQNAYDSAYGYPIQVRDAVGSIVSSADNTNAGQLYSVTDAMGNTTTFTYDAFGGNPIETPYDATLDPPVEP